ncbi:MAG: Dehydrogenases with different specificities (Related to short-chain alcohol dehydrogenases) [Limisphaerales bacterium]|nr:MAG: Dehydrogenases with different specificities (Related to short-chain alcohol dehydrogenases) [Limisphaerales bacterium]
MTTNPVALITGASRGIGRGIALELAKVGHDLVVNFSSSADGARQTAADCVAAAKTAGKAIRAEICQGDVGKAADRERLIAFTREQFGRLDLLVNNAGITSIGRRDILEAREDEFDALMAINLKGPYFLSQLAATSAASSGHPAVADVGVRAPAAGGYRPKIVIVSSISGYAVSTNRGDYCLAKAALGMMTKLYATRLADHGINVFEVCPGVIASDMTAPVKEKYDQLFADGLAPIRRWGTPEDVGRAITAIALDYLPYSTGETINVDGGFHVRRL